MSIARLKRLQRLEARQPKGPPWFDVYDAAIALWQAFGFEALAAGKASLVPLYGPPEAPTAAFELAMRCYDMMHERLSAKPA